MGLGQGGNAGPMENNRALMSFLCLSVCLPAWMSLPLSEIEDKLTAHLPLLGQLGQRAFPSHT